MRDGNWVKQSILDILEEEKQGEDKRSQGAFSFVPGVVLGAVVGGSLAKKREESKYKKMYGNLAQRLLNEYEEKTEQVVEEAIKKEKGRTTTNGPFSNFSINYYDQAERTIQNLRIIFTPLGVLFIMNGVTVDSLDVSELNDLARHAWKVKDESFFKRVYLNKVMIETQLAEEMFARKLVERNNTLKGFLAKKGSSEDELIDFDYLTQDVFFNPYEATGTLEEVTSIVKRSTESDLLAKYASDLFAGITDLGEITISDDIEVFKPLEYVSFDPSEKLEFFSLFSECSPPLPRKRQCVHDNLKLYFLPDRVLFLVNGCVLTQIITMQMSEATFEEFKGDNEDHFRNLFLSRVEKYLDDSQDIGAAPLEKSAEDNKYTGLFSRDDVHPKVYQQVFLDKFGAEWVDWDNDVIIKNVEDAFNISKIELTPFNKIMCIKLIQVSDAPFMGFLSFEKVARSFNNKYIDFELIEGNLEPYELMFAIRAIYEISDVDIYSLLSEHVYAYIKNILIENNCRVILPEPANEKERDFFKILTSDLLVEWNELMAEGIDNDDEINSLKKYNKAIHLATIKSLNLVGTRHLKEIVMKELLVLGFKDNPTMEDIVIKSVVDNIRVDKYLSDMGRLYDSQLKDYLG